VIDNWIYWDAYNLELQITITFSPIYTLYVFLDYRSGGPGSIPGTTRFSEGGKKRKKGKQVVGLEWGPLSLVSTTEELLDRKVAAPV
jgi:hypothetical protein